MAVVISASTTNTTQATVLWQNRLTALNYAASTSAVGYPAINATAADTATSWKPTAVPATLSFNYGSAIAIDSVGVAAHNLSTVGATINVQSSPNNSTWTTRATATPTNSEDLLFLFPSVSAQYWRVQITGGIANIGVLFFGSRLVFPYAPVDSYTPLNHARKYTKFFNTSLGGHLITNRVQSMESSTDVDLGFVQRTFVDGPLVEFKSWYDQGGTFFYAGCPSLYPLDIGYCTSGSEDETVAVEYIQGNRLANLSFGLRAYNGL